MGKLILAVILFAILFIAYKIIGKNNDGTKYRSHEEECEAFLTKYSVGYEEMRSVREMVEDRTPEIRELSSMLEEKIGMRPTPKMLEWGFLAKIGKIPYTFALSNISNEVLNGSCGEVYAMDIARSQRITRDEARERFRTVQLKFLKWYDEELRSHGMEYKLMYSRECLMCFPKRGGYDTIRGRFLSQAEWIGDCNNFKDATAFWEPCYHFMHIINTA